MKTGRVIVSLDDVAPQFQREIERQVAALHAEGITRLVLNVVPRWHGSNSLTCSPAFVAFLNQMLAEDAQLVMHGFEHQIEAPLRGSPIRVARARLFAAGSAEFVGPSLIETIHRVEAGMAEFERAGLPVPDTFCAPAWLMSDEAEEGIAEAGMHYIVGMFSLLDLQRNRLSWVPSSGFMGAGGWHELGVMTMNALTLPARRRASIVSVYLHPDPSGRGRWMGAVKQAARLVAGGREAVTFADVVR